MDKIEIQIVDAEFGNIIHRDGPFQTVAEAYAACKDVDLPDSRPIQIILLKTTELGSEILATLKPEDI